MRTVTAHTDNLPKPELEKERGRGAELERGENCPNLIQPGGWSTPTAIILGGIKHP